MKKLLGIMVLSLLLTNPAWSSPCIGWDNNGKDLVTGYCSDDMFSGYVQKTNAYAYGTCIDGMLAAWNSETGGWIYGDCDNEYIELYKKHKLD